MQKIYYVGKIMPCKFFQVSLHNFEYHTSPWINKNSQRYSFADSMDSMTQFFFKSNLKKCTRIFQMLSAIIKNILCLVKCLFVPKIQETLMNLNILYYLRPMYPGKHGETQFFLASRQKLRMLISNRKYSSCLSYPLSLSAPPPKKIKKIYM